MSAAEAGVASSKVEAFHFYLWGFNLALRIRLPLRDRLAWLALYASWYKLAKLIVKLPGKRYWERAGVAAGELAFATVRPRFTRVKRDGRRTSRD